MTNDPRFATIGVLAGLAVGLVLASTKADADSAKEVTTAASHAGLAARSADLKGTQMLDGHNFGQQFETGFSGRVRRPPVAASLSR